MSVLTLILLKIAPIFLVLLLGYMSFALRWVDTSFIGSANRLVFYVAMPALVFLNIAGADFSGGLPCREILAFTAAMILTTAAGYAAGGVLRLANPQKAAFVQGALRGNFAIIGLAVVDQVLGPEWVPSGALLIAFFLPLHNFASVVVLSLLGSDVEVHVHPLKKTIAVLVKSLRNPLISAIILGVIVSIADIPLPGVLTDTLTYLQRLALPLALVGIGGSVGEYRSGGHYPVAAASSFLKLFLLPLFAVIIGIVLGLSGESLVILAVFSGAPTAVASYAMADAMGADRDTAGSVILVTTASCFLSLIVILTVLKVAGFT
jgi:predicted permease